MLFLVEYDRSKGTIVSKRKFDDSESRAAEDARLNLELELSRKGVDHEVVLLEAPDEEALRRTHGRYFKDLATLAREGSGGW